MKTHLHRLLVVFTIASLVATQTSATCGGGGGGGRGGIGTGQVADEQVYHVPWRVLQPGDPAITSGLVVYWLPSSVDEARRSSLLFSRVLSVYAAQCVSMEIVDAGTPPGQKLMGSSSLPVAVLVTPDGTALDRAENNKGYLRAEQVEKMVEGELKHREDALNQQLKQAKEKSKSGDSVGAIPIYRSVYDQKCLFPKKAKDAAKELKKLGVNDVGAVADPPILAPAESRHIEQVMLQGLQAELHADYPKAEKLYAEAHNLDPNDPVPLRYLGELYRHHTGEWDKARATFDAILSMPADPLSRAVAQHGLGKMTIHDGDFAKGLALLEASVQTYPLALAYRNLAVYWNSEGDNAKADSYTRKALALDPTDPYNLVFAAAFMAGNGHGDEALKIARDNQDLLPASYNLAAVYAQVGDRDQALALLQRHFYQYERYQEVRAKEMMEARVDAVFASLRNDPAFLALTSGADGQLPMPASHAAGEGADALTRCSAGALARATAL
jgi:tetratricopeptide (TPR) repeat protein